MNDRILACLCLAFLFAFACGPDESNNATDCPEAEVCPADECSGAPTQDADEDGICDADDPCPNVDEPDSDGDGVCDSTDTCEGFPDWFDVDRDGLPAACDTCEDGDQSDADGDGVADPCDICAGHDDAADADGDGVPDGCDCDTAYSDDDACSDHPTGALCACDPDDPEDAEPCVDAAPRVEGLDDIVMSAGRTIELDLTVIENHVPWAEVSLEATSSNPMVVEPMLVRSPDEYCRFARLYEPVSIEGGFGFNENGKRGQDDIRQLELIFTERIEVRGELSIEHDSIAYFLDPMLICGQPIGGVALNADLQIYEEGKLSPGVYAVDDDFKLGLELGRAAGQSCETFRDCWSGTCREGTCQATLQGRERQPEADVFLVDWMVRAPEVPSTTTLKSTSPGQATIEITSGDGTHEATASLDVQVIPGCPIEQLPAPVGSSLECTGAGAEEVCEITCSRRNRLTNSLTGDPVSAVATCSDALSWQLSTDVDFSCAIPQPLVKLDDQVMTEDIPAHVRDSGRGRR